MASNDKKGVNPKSLENLRLGAETRNKDKQRTNLTLLPETVRWLKGCGNASDKVDELVGEARKNPFSQNQTDTVSELREKIKNLESQLKYETSRADELLKDQFKAADLLKGALKLKANAGGAIKEQIKKAIALLDDL